LSRREELRLRDILDAIDQIRAYVASGDFDRKTSDAVLYNLVVIGEAASQIGEELRAQAAEIPWAGPCA
jgi:uncharacterized protein with HEPN domain